MGCLDLPRQEEHTNTQSMSSHVSSAADMGTAALGPVKIALERTCVRIKKNVRNQVSGQPSDIS